MVDITQIGNWRHFEYGETESTNDEALRLSPLMLKGDKTVITAQRQTKGRGRRGRNWIGHDGNLFMSLLLDWPLAESGALVFCISLALLYAVRQLSSQVDVCLKWPNDVLISGRKISGILLETGTADKMIAGIGVNIIAVPAAGEMLYAVSSLKENGIDCDRLEFLRIFLEHFDRLCVVYKNTGMAEIASLWQTEAKGVGSPITVRLPKNEEKGIFKGIDDKGMLLLETSSGTIKTISAGDVFFDENK